VLHRTGAFEVIGPLARRLAGRGCEAIAWACTSGSFVGGYEWSRRQAAHLALESGRTCTSTTLALIEAARALGAGGVDVLSTYPGAGTRWFVSTLQQAGVAVVDVATHECDAPHLHDRYATYVIGLDGDALLGLIRSLPPSPRPLLVPNTSINTLDLVADLERESGRTIVTANQATLWWALRSLGVEGLARAGRLLDGSRS
jgi:maleate isomerase